MVSSEPFPRARLQIGNKTTITLPNVLHMIRFLISITLHDASRKLNAGIACSKRSDSGERCEVKKAMKSRGDWLLLPSFYFFALLFTSQRSPLSERLEQANAGRALKYIIPQY